MIEWTVQKERSARRNPMLLLRLAGELLLRFDARMLFGLLFQLPPRITRLEPMAVANIIVKGCGEVV